jgi:hypothetical protein
MMEFCMYFGLFESQADICRYFSLNREDLEGCEVLFAAYDCDYEGQALVVYRMGDKLYEVNGSHCSCYGLEDQWEPEETFVEALRHRIEKGTLGYFLGGYTADFADMLKRLSSQE